MANQKGGIGKTTLARMFAVYAARSDLLNKRVLAIDLDAQGSLSKLMLHMDESTPPDTIPPLHPEFDPETDEDWDGRSSSAEIFFSGEVFPYPVKLPYPIENLEILPAFRSRLQLVEEQDRTALRERVHNRLHEFLSLDDVQENYDLIIVDTGPKDSPLLRSALRAASHVVMPLVMETQCIDGLSEMLALWRTEREGRPPNRQIALAGLVINKFDARYAVHGFYMDQLLNDPRIAAFIAPVVLPQRAAMTERDARGAVPETVFDLPESQDIHPKSLALCRDIFTRLFPAEKARIARIKPQRQRRSHVAKPVMNDD